MSANIEALVKKHIAQYRLSPTGSAAKIIRAALTEQAEAFKGELQAYDGMVRELTKTVEDMRAAQAVPVVGEPAGYFPDESRADEIDAPPLPVYFAPTNSITAAELATLRELADAFTAERKARDSIAFEFNKVSRELEALRTEAERWRKANEGGKFCISEWAAISKEWVDMLPETAIERIDAAIAQGKGE